jgi:glycosyltransferase involved in cell wall biosynthesis
MPEISIIVPIYNVENNIRRCIESLLDQTFTDFELILVDDGSTDSSGIICDEFAKKHERIRVLHKKNEGVSSARNIGMAVSIGKYIGFVDSDDYTHREYLKELHETIDNNHADMAMCNFYLFSKGKKAEQICHGFDSRTCFDHKQIETVIYSRIFNNSSTGGYFALWNKILRKDFIIENDLKLDETVSFGEDMLFIMRCLKYCKAIAFSDKALYYYEMQNGGLFSKYRPSFLEDIMKCYNAVIDQTTPKNSKESDYLPLSIKYFFYIKRHMQGIIYNEKRKSKMLYLTFKNRDVKIVFKRIVFFSEEVKKKYNIDEYDLMIPKLVLNKRIALAILYARYQFDDDFWFKKVRNRIRLKKRNRSKV